MAVHGEEAYPPDELVSAGAKATANQAAPDAKAPQAAAAKSMAGT